MGSAGFRIEVDLDLCQGHAMCELEAPDYFRGAQARQGRDPRRRAARRRPRRSRAGRRYVPHASTIHQRERRLTMASLLPRRTRRMGRPLAAGQQGLRKGRRLEAAGGLLHRRRHLRLEHRPQGRRHVRRRRRDPRHRTRSGDGGPGELGVRVPEGAHRRQAGRDRRLLEADRQQDATAPSGEIYGIGGSWFRLNADKLIEWQRDFFDFGHVAEDVRQSDRIRRLSAPACRSESSAASPARSCPATTRWARRPSRSGEAGANQAFDLLHALCWRHRSALWHSSPPCRTSSGQAVNFKGEMGSGPT